MGSCALTYRFRFDLVAVIVGAGDFDLDERAHNAAAVSRLHQMSRSDYLSNITQSDHRVDRGRVRDAYGELYRELFDAEIAVAIVRIEIRVEHEVGSQHIAAAAVLTEAAVVQLHRSIAGLIVERDHLDAAVPQLNRVVIRRVESRSFRIHSAELDFVCLDEKLALLRVNVFLNP